MPQNNRLSATQPAQTREISMVTDLFFDVELQTPGPSRRWLGVALSCAVFGATGCLRTPDRFAQSTLDVNINPPASFELEGKPFCFAGSNNYYLASKPRPMVDDVYRSAKKLGFSVMRTWAFVDIGSTDGSVASVDPHSDNNDGKKDGTYFQYWDKSLGRVVYNDGEDGLQRLDYAVAKAAEHDVKMILVLTNNWFDFGGMDQYLRWFGRVKHHEFYTDPVVKNAFKDWIAHLVNRTNTVNGRKYRDDPAIFAWELANEPRCKGTGPGATGWTKSTIPVWADEMSSYIRSIDPNHMIAAGDEGFLNGGGEHWAYQANDGVDNEAITAVKNIDFGTFHLYPEDWGATLDWGRRWVLEHERVARRLNKPTILEEYGVKVSRDDKGAIVAGLQGRLAAYKVWNDLMFTKGGNGTMAWILAGVGPQGGVYTDYDHYTFYLGDETANFLADVASRFKTAAPACMSAGPSSATSSPSPYVRVRRSADRVAFVSGLPQQGG
jgi:mannan endo-1,4-beta-mannosidase